LQRFGGNCAKTLREFRTTSKAAALAAGIIRLGTELLSLLSSQLGFSIGWTMLLTFPLMAAIQEISARIGRTTGHGIAGNLGRH